MPISGCVTLSKLFNLSEPCSLHIQREEHTAHLQGSPRSEASGTSLEHAQGLISSRSHVCFVIDSHGQDPYRARSIVGGVKKQGRLGKKETDSPTILDIMS